MGAERDGTVVIATDKSVERAWVDPGWRWQVYRDGALVLKSPHGDLVHFERGAWFRVWATRDGVTVADAIVARDNPPEPDFGVPTVLYGEPAADKGEG